MSQILAFAGEHPFVSLVAFYIAAQLAFRIIQTLFFSLPNRVFRHLNICVNGYPPEHCDADGDFRQLP